MTGTASVFLFPFNAPVGIYQHIYSGSFYDGTNGREKKIHVSRGPHGQARVLLSDNSEMPGAFHGLLSSASNTLVPGPDDQLART